MVSIEKINPLGSRTVVERYEDDKMGSIIIPDQAKKASLRGIVRETGADCKWVVEGDWVIFGRYSGFELPVRVDNYRNCLLMNEEDILCKLDVTNEEEV